MLPPLKCCLQIFALCPSERAVTLARSLRSITGPTNLFNQNGAEGLTERPRK